MVGFFFVSYPFAILALDEKNIRISYFGRNIDFQRIAIKRLSRRRGWLSLGLCIEHHLASVPSPVIFWASAFFFTSGFRTLEQRLRQFGYDIDAVTPE